MGEFMPTGISSFALSGVRTWLEIPRMSLLLGSRSALRFFGVDSATTMYSTCRKSPVPPTRNPSTTSLGNHS